MYTYIYICLIYIYTYACVCLTYIYMSYTHICMYHIYIYMCMWFYDIYISWKVMWIVGKTWVHDGKWWKLDKKMEYNNIMESCCRNVRWEDHRSRRVFWTWKLWASKHTSAISGPIDTMQTLIFCVSSFC